MAYNSSSKTYAVSMAMCQLVVIGLLNVINISPTCSHHIKLFLRIFIPAIMLGEIVLLFIARKRDWVKIDRIADLKLIVHGFLAFVVGSCVYHVVTVLLGASLIDVVEETFLFSCLCSALTVFPLYIVHNSQWEEFINCLPETLDVRNHLPDAVKMVAYFTVVGAWVGAFPIPLDWDRDWQTWPITCCVSAIGGNVIGHLVVSFRCTGIVDRMFYSKWKSW